MISVYNDEKFCSQCNVNVAKVDKMLERIKNLSGIKNEKHN